MALPWLIPALVMAASSAYGAYQQRKAGEKEEEYQDRLKGYAKKQALARMLKSRYGPQQPEAPNIQDYQTRAAIGNIVGNLGATALGNIMYPSQRI